MCTKLDVKPRNCVVIEDSIIGVKAAISAGMCCIAVASGSYSKQELKKENPNIVINSLEEKNKILNFILD
ncbi:MAG: HAD hydrolase-like protein [Candidatus Bathyarchaeota archaeon]